MAKNIVAAQVNWSQMAGTSSSYLIDVRDYLGKEADVFGTIVRCVIQDDDFGVSTYGAKWNEAQKMHLLTLPPMREGRYAFELSLVFDSGEEAVLAQGWIGCFNRLEWNDSPNVHASPNRTLLIPRADSKGNIKVQWMASGAAEGFAFIARTAAHQSETSATSSANSASEAQEYRNSAESFSLEANSSKIAAEKALLLAAEKAAAASAHADAAAQHKSDAEAAAAAAAQHKSDAEAAAAAAAQHKSDAEAAAAAAAAAAEEAAAAAAEEAVKDVTNDLLTSIGTKAEEIETRHEEVNQKYENVLSLNEQVVELNNAAANSAKAAKDYSTLVVESYMPRISILSKSAETAAASAETSAREAENAAASAVGVVDTIDSKVEAASAEIDSKVEAASAEIDEGVAIAISSRLGIPAIYAVTEDEFLNLSPEEGAAYFII